jgi:hypothetical protein
MLNQVLIVSENQMKKCSHPKHAAQKAPTTSIKHNAFYIHDKSIYSIKISLKTLFLNNCCFQNCINIKK